MRLFYLFLPSKVPRRETFSYLKESLHLSKHYKEVFQYKKYMSHKSHAKNIYYKHA